MPDTDPTIGQALYTWSLQTLRGNAGWGFASASPSALPLVDRLEEMTDVIKYFPLDGSGSGPSPLVADRQIIGRLTLGDRGVIVSKTYQGKDAHGRQGRYANQVLVGPGSRVSVSATLRLRKDRLLGPHSREIADFTAPTLSDSRVEDVFTSPAGGAILWADVESLLTRLDAANWRSATLAEQELPALPALMDLLGASWDAGSSLVPTIVGTEIRWRLTLARSREDVPGARFSGRLEPGTQWLEAQERLEGAVSTDALASQWRALSTTPAVGALNDDLILENAIYEFTQGDGTYLSALLKGVEGFAPVGMSDVVAHLADNGLRLPDRGVGSDRLTARILAQASASPDVLRRILPIDRSELGRVARSCLTPEVFAEVSARNADTSDRDVVRVLNPEVDSDLWTRLGEIWDGEPTLRRGAIRTLHASGPELTGILGRLIMSGGTIPVDLLFGRIVPETFTPIEARKLLEVDEELFLQWSGLSQFYLDALRRGGGLFAWLGRSRKRRVDE